MDMYILVVLANSGQSKAFLMIRVNDFTKVSHLYQKYNKTCLKRPLSKDKKLGSKTN